MNLYICISLYTVVRDLWGAVRESFPPMVQCPDSEVLKPQKYNGLRDVGSCGFKETKNLIKM